MMALRVVSALEMFCGAVTRQFGLAFDGSKLSILAEVLESRAAACGLSEREYAEKLHAGHLGGAELRRLAPRLTISETYFFRHYDQFRAFAEVALPDRLANRGSSRLAVMSAGCASGEEPYSLAMLIRQMGIDPHRDAKVRGVDVSANALERGRAGRFSAWALRETPSALRDRWFGAEGRDFLLDPSIVSSVELEERNLVRDDADLWPPGAYDVVFCRNVLMYFTLDQARALVARICAALAPGGYLFLGHAETLRGLSQGFDLMASHDTFYYRRKLDDAVAPPPPSSVFDARPASDPPVVTTSCVGWAPAWVETVRATTERIRALDVASSEVAGRTSEPSSTAFADLSDALRLLAEERLSEALERMRGLPAEVASSSDARLLHAALCTQSGLFDDAERSCNDLLCLDPEHAGAHYLLALCRDGTGDLSAAFRHDQTAAYLDPSFAMPRLHLGLLARRAGDHETAKRELDCAHALLEREEASRITLFGGGFSRNALMGLCRGGPSRSGASP
jgi:chemotaxis protein methyltransferase CheR